MTKAPPLPLSFPEKLSDLVELAIKDLEETDIEIYMGIWYSNKNGNCMACFAGNCLARQFERERGRLPRYSEISYHNNVMYTLESIRKGNLYGATYFWYGKHHNIEGKWVHNYYLEPEKFIQDMKDIVVELRNLSL